jgi:hypothetical protein
MKKIVLFFLVLVLLGIIGVTGLAWAQGTLMQQAPAPKQPYQDTAPPTTKGQLLPLISPKTVFVSSVAHTGSLGGLAGADQLCQRLASAAGLTGTYKAWLSDGKGVNPITTFTHGLGPYKLRNGVVVANNWNELISTGKLLYPININEKGAPVPANYVWTGFPPSSGTNPDGSRIWVTETPNTCSGWTAAYGSIAVGWVGYMYSPATAYNTQLYPYAWTYAAIQSCSPQYTSERMHIYCFEQ